MGRTLLAAIAALSLAACGDPLVVVGDAPGFMRITAGVPDTLGIRNDTIATRLRLTRPAGLVVSKTGVLYFADQSARIFSVTSSGKTTVLHESLNCFVKTCLARPQGVALTNDGNALIIGDNQSDKIWRFTLTNKELVAIAGTGVNGTAADGTVALQAPLASPAGVAVLSDGRVLFAERESGRVRILGTDGILRTLVSGLTQPTALVAADNTVYVSETGSANRVIAVDLATGATTRIAGNGNTGYSGDGGPATDAALNTPWALALADNNLYIADQGNNRVRVVNLTTHTIGTFAGTGTTGFTGNGRSASETSIVQPGGLAVSGFGFLYISDWGHSVIWRTPVRINTL